MDNDLRVRVDYYNDGRILPISFVHNSLNTKFIRKIKQIWQECDSQSHEIICYHCLLTDNTTTILSFKDGRWYI